MNDPDDDNVDARLRATLEDHAGDAPLVDLTGGVLDRARRIRARRRVAGAVAVAVVAAIAVPVANSAVGDQNAGPTPATQATTAGPVEPSQTSQQASPTAPPATPPDIIDLALDGLPRGSDPSVPYIDDRTFHAAGGSTTQLSLPGTPYSATVLPDGTVLGWYTRPDYSRSYGSGDNQILPSGKSVVAGPVVDSDGSVAWIESAADQDGNQVGAVTLRYASGLDDISSASLDQGGIDGIAAVRQEVVYFTAYRGNKSVVFSVDMGASQPPVRELSGVTEISAVSPDGSLLSVYSDNTVEVTDAPCATTVDAVTLDALWESCVWRPTSFSADGARVIAQPVYGDGFGPRELAVLDATTGSALQEFTAAGTFGAQVFEDSDTVAMVIVDDSRQAAIVRCTVGETCELATELRPAAPDSLSSPYQLTPQP